MPVPCTWLCKTDICGARESRASGARESQVTVLRSLRLSEDCLRSRSCLSSRGLHSAPFCFFLQVQQKIRSPVSDTESPRRPSGGSNSQGVVQSFCLWSHVVLPAPHPLPSPELAASWGIYSLLEEPFCFLLLQGHGKHPASSL